MTAKGHALERILQKIQVCLLSTSDRAPCTFSLPIRWPHRKYICNTLYRNHNNLQTPLNFILKISHCPTTLDGARYCSSPLALRTPSIQFTVKMPTFAFKLEIMVSRWFAATYKSLVISLFNIHFQGSICEYFEHRPLQHNFYGTSRKFQHPTL